MSYNTIRYAVDNGVATVMRELLHVLDVIDADDAVRAAIVTGEGRAFCAGADLSSGTAAFKTNAGPDSPVRPDGTLNYAVDSARDGGGRVTLRMFQCLKPLIAAINGPAVGIGATMTLPMDIRLASDKARVGFVFARRGIVPEAASCYFLPRIVGISRALEWCYSGRVHPATEMKAAGLIREIYPESELLPAASEVAREIAENTSPVSVALIRQMMWRGLGMSHPMDAHRVDSRGILSRGRSADVAEGVNSFLEKRAPNFTDRVSADMPDYFPWWEEPHYR